MCLQIFLLCYSQNECSLARNSAAMLRDVLLLETFRSEYEIEYEYDFSNLVFMHWIVTFRTNLRRTNSLLFNWSATWRSEGSENMTGLKFESRTRIPI